MIFRPNEQAPRSPLSSPLSNSPIYSLYLSIPRAMLQPHAAVPCAAILEAALEGLGQTQGQGQGQGLLVGQGQGQGQGHGQGQGQEDVLRTLLHGFAAGPLRYDSLSHNHIPI